MISAKAFYDGRKGNSFAAKAARVATYAYLNIRPPVLRVERNQLVRVFEQYARPAGGRRTVLLLGSNMPRTKLSDFVGHDVKQVDRLSLSNVDVVADAEQLTRVVPEASADYVVSTSMLEHTLHPISVIEEVFKVLRPGGIFYVGVPWMFPLHGEPHDFWRFSLPCLRAIMAEAGFKELESGSEYSPHAALHNLLKTYLCEVLSFDSTFAFYSLEYAFDWLLSPMALMERKFRLSARSNYYTDSIFYLVGQKPESATV